MDKNMSRRETGFTLIELLIVVAIVGIIAAIAIPNLLTAMQRSKQKRTMADMRTIAIAWESRAVDMGGYNAAGVELCCTVTLSTPAVLDILQPTFVNPLPQKDGWLRPFEFAVNTDGTQYLIRSYGSNGLRDETVAGGGTSQLDCDIVYSGGEFLQYPTGIQTQ
jgi:general secretion pathway protein G